MPQHSTSPIPAPQSVHQFATAMAQLTEHGHVEILATRAHLQTIADIAEPSDPELASLADQLIQASLPTFRAIALNEHFVASLSRTGVRKSGRPFYSIKCLTPADARGTAGPVPHTETEDPAPAPTRTMSEWHSAAPGPTPHPTEQPEQPNPRYPALRLRSQLSELDRDTRIDLLTSLLADELLEYAVDASNNPVEFTRLVSSVTEEQANILAFKTGASA